VGAEFPGQRPVGAAPFGYQPEKDPRSGSVFGDFVKIVVRVGSEHADALFVRVGDVLRLFDRVAETYSAGCDAETQEPVDLVPGRGVEAGTQVLQKKNDLVHRICLDGVIDLREGQLYFQVLVPAPDGVQAHRDERGFLRVGESLDTREKFRSGEPIQIKGVGLSFHNRFLLSCAKHAGPL